MSDLETLATNVQANLDARIDDDVLPVAETPIEEPPTQDRLPAVPTATQNQVINKLRHGRADTWIKHNVTNPSGKHLSLEQIQLIRELWLAEVVERTPEP